MARRTGKATNGNFIAEWFGHRVWSVVDASDTAVRNQSGCVCPFLSNATATVRRCIKAAKGMDEPTGVCTWRGHVVQFQVKMLGREPGARETSLRYEGRWLYLMDPVPCGSVASPMRFASKIALLLLAFLAALALGWLVFSKEGGCRPDPRPRPACHPGDKECNVDEPGGPSVPSIGKAP